jgi:EEF1A lysine methyltransferase 4
MFGLRPGRRREAQGTFDWFKSYEDVAHLLRPLLPDKTARILILGCGNSTLSEDVCVCSCCNAAIYLSTFLAQMYDDGYKNIVNVDVRLCYVYC